MEPITRTIENIDWITVVIFCSILFLVIAKSLFYGRFMNFIILPFNNKYIFLYNKKDKLMNWFHVFFTIFQLINFSLFIYLAWTIILMPLSDSSPFIFSIILGSLIVFLILKIGLQMASGYIFGSNRVISELIFKKLSYLNYSALIMLIANISLLYVAKGSAIVVYVALVLVLLVNTIGWVTALRTHQKFLAYNFFYFILYLCALEIAPFVIIGSYLKDS